MTGRGRAGLGVAQLGAGAGSGAGSGAGAGRRLGCCGFLRSALLLWRALLCSLLRRFLRRGLLRPSWRTSCGLLCRLLRNLLGGLLCRLLLFRRYGLLGFFRLLGLLRLLRHRINPPVAADQKYRTLVDRRCLRRQVDQFGPGRGPPVAQSRSSIVCTTGTDVPPAICTMQPILPAAIISGSTFAILATLRSRNLFAMSGWRMLYVPAEPQHKWLSGTSFTTNPFLESNSFGACVIFCPCCSEQAA